MILLVQFLLAHNKNVKPNNRVFSQKSTLDAPYLYLYAQKNKACYQSAVQILDLLPFPSSKSITNQVKK